jgi:DNA processing protein
LLARIADEGLVVTEHPPRTPPLPRNFPRRNRILVGLAEALLLVEARLKSGSLTSVRWAADLGREVLVVPGPVDAPLSEGPLTLLREGCTPVGSGDHVLLALGLSPREGRSLRPSKAPSGLDPAAQHLLALLGGGGLDLDEVVRVSGEAPGRVLAILLGLEVQGFVRKGPGMVYEAVATTAGDG